MATLWMPLQALLLRLQGSYVLHCAVHEWYTYLIYGYQEPTIQQRRRSQQRRRQLQRRTFSATAPGAS